ncbi:hypothetical protein F0169_18290 [Pseudomonas sp. MAFF 212408]|uniref:DUF4123 domain-containing protein n=1 Tax=Pseudomonas kitaguniensis TaxID=2607908 RepID=A0A5N7KNX1_9PSED|nr:hypothetical protein [Pseudomonas kitaguniensis]
MYALANTAHFALVIPAVRNDFKVLAFHGTEAISSLYAIQVELVSEYPDFGLENLLSQPAFLQFGLNGEGIHGRIEEVCVGEAGKRLTRYHLTLVQALHYLQISVCYWHGAGWEIAHDPAPGEHPLPADPLWLNVPVPASLSMEMLRSNIYRYLWAEHSDDLMRLSQRHDPGTWLTEQLSQAQEWGWSAPEQVHFLIISKLNEAEPPLIKNWLPHNGEAPQVHFERLCNEVKFWSGESSV